MRELRYCFELREIHVELKRAPEAAPRFLRVACAHQQVQRIGMIREQVRRDVGTDVAGGPGQKYGHGVWVQGVVAGDLPAAPAALTSVCAARGTLRRGRASG